MSSLSRLSVFSLPWSSGSEETWIVILKLLALLIVAIIFF